MYQRVLACDPAWNGRFFTGVLTTGIYCLPSCRARKPRPENVRFFPTCEAARAAGLRPCRKCHPDDFARGADPVLEAVESVVGEIRRDPAAFPDTRTIVRRLGFGTTRTFELFRQHYHTTPADLLLRARIDAATSCLLVTPTAGKPQARRRSATAGRSAPSIAGIGYAVGFDAVSAFHENFRRLTGLTPAAYRELRPGTAYKIALPDGYLLGYLRRALSRDPQSVSERLDGDCYTAAVRLAAGPAILRLQLGPRAVEVSLELRSAGGTERPGTGPGVAPERERGPRPPGAATPCPAPDTAIPAAAEAHALVVRLLGLDEDAAAFVRLARKLGLARLVAGREELRISRTPSVFDGLLWSIIGQQINFSFACVLKRRLFERVGVPVGDGLVAPPTPEAVAALEPADLLPLQFSRQKAAYLIGTAQAVVRGELDLDALPGFSATRAERTLLALHGLGPWSVNYVMMRSLGFADCVPLGDTGVTSGLQTLLELAERPDADATRRLMAVFSPYRSLATAHLWQLNSPFPGEPPGGMQEARYFAPAACSIAPTAGPSRPTAHGPPPTPARQTFRSAKSFPPTNLLHPSSSLPPMNLFHDSFSTPFGDFSVAVDSAGAVVATAFGGLPALLRRLNIMDDSLAPSAGGSPSAASPETGFVNGSAAGGRPERTAGMRAARRPACHMPRDQRKTAAAREQVLAYFAGARREFHLPLAARGTPFQQQVWTELRRIPYGETRSYRQIATRLGRPGASRAVGRANATNPICLIVPCHRVIGSDGSLTGFAFGEELKRALLEFEAGFATADSIAAMA